MIDEILILLAFASGRKWGKPLKCSIGFNIPNICSSFCFSYICSLADFSDTGILNVSSLLSPAAVIGHCLWELEAHKDDWARCINIISYLCIIHYIENIFCIFITWNRNFGRYHLLDAMYVFFYIDLKSNCHTCITHNHVCCQYFGSRTAMSAHWYPLN